MGEESSSRVGAISAVVFSGFAAAHLIDDFVAHVPADFHLSVPTTELLALIFMLALVGLIVLASRGSRRAHAGLAIVGLLIVAAQLVKSVPEILAPGPWRSGVVSDVLVIGLIASALPMVIAGLRLGFASRNVDDAI
jgi:hypothetical protein